MSFQCPPHVGLKAAVRQYRYSRVVSLYVNLCTKPAEEVRTKSRFGAAVLLRWEQVVLDDINHIALMMTLPLDHWRDKMEAS